MEALFFYHHSIMRSSSIRNNQRCREPSTHHPPHLHWLLVLPGDRRPLLQGATKMFSRPARYHCDFFPSPFLGRGGRGVRGGARSCKPPVQFFVILSETRQCIRSTIKNPIKSQCKTPHPQPLSPKKGRGEQSQTCG